MEVDSKEKDSAIKFSRSKLTTHLDYPDKTTKQLSSNATRKLGSTTRQLESSKTTKNLSFSFQDLIGKPISRASESEIQSPFLNDIYRRLRERSQPKEDSLETTLIEPEPTDPEDMPHEDNVSEYSNTFLSLKETNPALDVFKTATVSLDTLIRDGTTNASLEELITQQSLPIMRQEFPDQNLTILKISDEEETTGIDDGKPMLYYAKVRDEATQTVKTILLEYVSIGTKKVVRVRTDRRGDNESFDTKPLFSENPPLGEFEFDTFESHSEHPIWYEEDGIAKVIAEHPWRFKTLLGRVADTSQITRAYMKGDTRGEKNTDEYTSIDYDYQGLLPMELASSFYFTFFKNKPGVLFKDFQPTPPIINSERAA